MKTETIMTLNDSNIKTVLVAFCTLISLTGCSDLSISDGNMENIFSSRRDDVLVPKEILYDSRSFTEYSTALQFIYGTLREYRYGYYDDVAAVYNDIVCMDDPEPVYLAAVYPKLETGRIGVFCWNNY